MKEKFAAMTIAETTFAALDFEAAGAVPDKPDVPIQIGIASGRPGEQPVLYDSFLAIDRPVTRGAQRVHGITDAQLAGAPTLLQLYPTLKQHLGNRPLVAHAHGTEKRFLASLPGHPFGPWLDTLKLARKVYPQAESHRLGGLCDALGLTPRLRELVPGRDWHDALFDAAASLILLFHIVEELDLAEHPLGTLRL
ncbi:3'-5' exonuclease [Roseibacillus persicicus]|uniref:3'-5' exonuclease n=1 Tax=Roseibacillus persicicus TaxID=454148 RepID=UPI002811318C|nr:3'-5' exonuclease [Roseibacillus persicicus]